MLISLLIPQLLAATVASAGVTRDTLSLHSTIVPGPIIELAETVGFRYAKVSGRVLDSNRSPVPNALLSIDMIAGGHVSSAWLTTDATGHFVKDSLLPGMRYVIEVRCHGYRKSVSNPIVASADSLRTVEIVLIAETSQLPVARQRARSPED